MMDLFCGCRFPPTLRLRVNGQACWNPDVETVPAVRMTAETPDESRCKSSEPDLLERNPIGYTAGQRETRLGKGKRNGASHLAARYFMATVRATGHDWSPTMGEITAHHYESPTAHPHLVV